MDRFTVTRPSCQPALRRIPWLVMVLVLIIVACMGASTCIVIVSDKQAVSSWKVQPTVLLAVLSSIFNFALGTTLSMGVAVTWWRSALHGTTLARLHYIWDRGIGYSFASAFKAGFDTRRVALVATAIAVVELINNPLLQRSTHIRAQEIVTNETMKMDLAQRLPDGWTGTIGNGSAITMIGSRYGLSDVQAWWRNDTIMSHNKPGYYCNGTCNGRVQGSGIKYNCSSTTEALDLSTRNSDGSIIFAINSTMSTNSTGVPFLFLTTLYSSAVNDSCVATLTVDTCQIEAAVVEYPVTIQNSTVILNYGRLQDMPVTSTYISAGDLPTAPRGAGAGPLAGLNNFFGYYLYANVTEVFDPDLGRSTYSGPSMIADLFFDPEASSYDNHTFAKCGLKWSSPTSYVLNSMHDFMFRAALRVGNGIEVQTFKAQRTSAALLFHSEPRYLASALAVMLLALLAVLSLLWGWWELGRLVSLSPLETAKAFGAPMMQSASQHSTIEGILKEIGETKFKYDERILLATEGGERKEVGGHDHETQLNTGKNRVHVIELREQEH
ncbi:MAG: hypothetical protein M1840_005902 [Geoglossum simile]|nr:MAG: hypothetical protein M1840_005902 [Geoglossum simile]